MNAPNSQTDGIYEKVQEAHDALANAAETLGGMGGDSRIVKAWQSVNAAVNATGRAVKHLGAALGITAAVAMSQSAAGYDSANPHDPDQTVAPQTVTGADGPMTGAWRVQVQQSQEEGITRVAAVVGEITDASNVKAQLGVACELGHDEPTIILGFQRDEDERVLGAIGTLNMQFDNGLVFSQWVDPADTSPMLFGTIGVRDYGYDKSDFLRTMSQSESLTVEAAAKDSRIAKFNLNDPVFQHAVNMIDDICPMKSHAEIIHPVGYRFGFKRDDPWYNIETAQHEVHQSPETEHEVHELSRLDHELHKMPVRTGMVR